MFPPESSDQLNELLSLDEVVRYVHAVERDDFTVFQVDYRERPFCRVHVYNPRIVPDRQSYSLKSEIILVGPELFFEELVGRGLIDEETFMPRSVFDQRHLIIFSPGTRILTEISFESFHAPGHFRRYHDGTERAD